MKALQPHNLSEFCDVEITPKLFSVKIIGNDHYSQQYAVRVAEFAKFCNRDHPMFSGDEKVRLQFYTDLDRKELTPHVLEYLINIIVVSWELKGDDDKLVPYSEEKALEIFSDYPRIARQLLFASRTTELFEQDALKNS